MEAVSDHCKNNYLVRVNGRTEGNRRGQRSLAAVLQVRSDVLHGTADPLKGDGHT